MEKSVLASPDDGAASSDLASTEPLPAPQPTSSFKEATELLDWDGPDDPENPHNWPMWKRILHTAIPAVYAFGLCVGISTFIASITIIQLEFNISRNVALLPVSLYTVGFIIGPCIASPISELYGRRWIYWVNLPCLVVFNAIAVASDNLTVLILFRFLAGTFGSGVLAVGAGTLSDLWNKRDGGRVAISYILAPFLGPSLGPLIGAYVVHEHGNDWKWAIWVVLCIEAPVAVAMIFMKETSKTRILELRARRRAEFLVDESAAVIAAKIGKAMLRPLHMCIFEPLSLFIGLYTAYSFAMIFSFFGSYTLVYTTVYGFNLREVGLCFIPVIIGFLFAIATVGIIDAKVYQKEVIRTNDKVAPEHRLYAALLGSFLIPIGLFWYAWAPRQGVHWIVPLLAGLPFGWGALASFLSCIGYIVDVYGTENAASAVAANGMLRFALGAAFPQFILQVYQADMGIHWVGSIFAFIGVAMIPVPWLFFWKGRELREKSRYIAKSN